LICLCAVIKAVDTYAALLRVTVASAANDHRLGSHEAPPAIISIYLGEQLNDIIEQIEKGALKGATKEGTLEVGIDSLPPLPRHASDRNRTSPFAFTGSKFEFRAVGSSQSLSGPNVVLNMIVADALKDICDELENVSKKDLNKTVQKLLQSIIKKHKRVIFNGDNYTEAWVKEAKKRGLPNNVSTPEALEAIKDPAVAPLFERHKVLNKTEVISRYDTYKEQYNTIINYEAALSVDMAKTMFIPAAVAYAEGLSASVKSIEGVNKGSLKGIRAILKEVSKYTEAAIASADKLEKAVAGGKSTAIIAVMKELRGHVDALEALLPKDAWPVPSYTEMLFMS
ncbi:MAG: glutamine synthetase type III, partial [Candidatus Omnitrophica bacterium CG12_big_fil_rev_8_21_14_0_65_50_5]